jgi:hypothetical protein
VIVFVAGMSRAGSMWTYNIVRELYKQKKIATLPDQIPLNESNLISEAFSSDPSNAQVYCIKTHFNLPHPLPTKHQVKIICNFRDVRDAGLSFNRFVHSDYSTVINAMKGMMGATDYYLNTFKDIVMPIRFDSIQNEPSDTINRICEYLDLNVSDKTKADIELKFSKKSVKKQIDKLSDIKVKEGEIKGAKYQNNFAAVSNLDGSYRVFDKETSFQSNHITSKKDGEWRDFFSEEQKKEINDISKEWLSKYGFDI